MIIIYIIIAFLLGIIFVQWIIPVGDSLINLFLTQLEVWKGHMAIKITQYQEQASKIKKDLEEKQLSSIGFTITEGEDDENEQVL